MTQEHYDVTVLGGGPGGYVAAIQAGKRGMRAALIESRALGGACLHWGCVPTKTLLESARRLLDVRSAAALGIDGVDPDAVRFNWPRAIAHLGRIVDRQQRGVALLLREAEVDVIEGFGTPRSDGLVEVSSADGELREVHTDNLVIATGSRADPIALAPVGERALEIERFLGLADLPDAAAVWGSGAEAVEVALFLALVGVRTSLVTADQALLPALDSDLGAFARRRLSRAGIALYLGRRPRAMTDDGVALDDATLVPGAFLLNLDRRTPAVESLGALDLEMRQGFIKVDGHGATSLPATYAVGDVTGRSMLAHGASAQAVAAVTHIAGGDDPVDLERVPWNVHLFPEIASVGASEERLRARGVDFDKNLFPVAANSKAQIEGITEGFVKVLTDRRYGEVLGVHVVAPRATELIAEASLAMRFSLTALEVAQTIHPHPTVSEIMMEAHRAMPGT